MLASADSIYAKVMIHRKDEVRTEFFGDDDERRIREIHGKV